MGTVLRRGASLALLWGPAAAFALGAWSRRWVAEDGFITLRVAEQVLAGHGPVFNVGERVEAVTSPLWLAIVSGLGAALRSLSMESIAVGAGLVCAVTGLVFAQLGARRLAVSWAEGHTMLLLPLGALVVAVLPPFWDFSTAGLELGLTFLWLGACCWRLARLATGSARATPPPGRPTAELGLAVMLGLGPLVRPDLTLISIALVAGLLAATRGTGWRRRILCLVAASVLPLAYELFRMGFYALPVPTPALTKEASLLRPDQGLAYLRDFADSYWLAVPAAATIAILAACVASALRARDRALAAALSAPPIGGLAHIAYIVAIGGDFMRARLLLPGLFALLAPVAVVVPRGLVVRGAVAVAAIWTVAALTVLGPGDAMGPRGIVDERALWVVALGKANPVHVTDYAERGPAQGLYHRALEVRDHRREHVAVLGPTLLPLAPHVRAGALGITNLVGVFSYAAGPDTHVVDYYGLTEPIGARLGLTRRGRPGHEKFLPYAWTLARFLPDQVAPPDPDVQAAQAALRCGRLHQLVGAISQPLTVDRFLHNLVMSAALYRLRIPADPKAAVAAFCPTNVEDPSSAGG